MFGGLLIFKFPPVSRIHSTIEVGNKIALGAIVKPIVCVHFLNTDLTKWGIRLMDFKRMDEVKGVLVSYNFDSA